MKRIEIFSTWFVFTHDVFLKVILPVEHILPFSVGPPLLTLRLVQVAVVNELAEDANLLHVDQGNSCDDLGKRAVVHTKINFEVSEFASIFEKWFPTAKWGAITVVDTFIVA